MPERKIWNTTILLRSGYGDRREALIHALHIWRYKFYRGYESTFQKVRTAGVYRDDLPHEGHIILIFDGAQLTIEAYEHVSRIAITLASELAHLKLDLGNPDSQDRAKPQSYAKAMAVFLEEMFGNADWGGPIMDRGIPATRVADLEISSELYQHPDSPEREAKARQTSTRLRNWIFKRQIR